MNWVTISVVVFIILFTYYIFNARSQQYEKFVYGLWEGDSGFCDKSDTSSMKLFIGEPSISITGAITRKGYLIINNDICNQPIEIKYRRPWLTNISLPTDVKSYRLYTTINYDEDETWPKDLILDVDMMTGYLKVHDGKTLYGKFYKDNEVTHMAHSENEASKREKIK